jgi:peptidoglycan hydrolase CwlO-like protein
MDKLKYILITIGVCVVLSAVFYIIQEVRHKRELKQRTEIAYIRGKSETLIDNSEFLINQIDIQLKNFEKKIDNYNKTIDKLREVTDNVNKKVVNLSNIINQFDIVFTDLHNSWTGSE